MTTRAALLALAERIEREAPSLELLDRVLLASGWRVKGDSFIDPKGEAWVPWHLTDWRLDPMRSLDAAVATVPADEKNLPYEMKFLMHKSGRATVILIAFMYGEVTATAATPAAALTAASLRARAAMMDDVGG